MLYAVISHFDSIREVTLGFKSHISRLNHLGINYIVRRSTLSDANKRRASSAQNCQADRRRQRNYRFCDK
jgi:hypothetical protein